ncbi:MAG: Arginyl-tRNA synthetase [uncultured Thermomicrobiales bacterium]|uniref:Arginine--tRNA ligase n=1 Tax=uncultured Thermomicrobiales bacterium TaxID=1645740 RepID=A0A6J4V3V6_9BACT|nr:MAG: Arginyl-tRNA synthetase [uncultured Thermomicrobiales bacterium]
MSDETRETATGAAEAAGSAIATPNGHVATEEGRSKARAGVGILAGEERRAAEAIAGAIAGLGLPARHVDLRPLPFAGTWGVASSVCFGLANDAVMADLAAAGELEGLSRKEAKRLAADRVRERVVSLAEEVAAATAAGGHGFARVEAANGYVNVSFDANAMAARLIGEVLGQGAVYGTGAPLAEQVMIEHSQPNTHKAFHVGHLRNSCLGVSLSRILRAAGYAVRDANYIGDIGMHVVKCLWCYERFHKGQEPAAAEAKGRWLGEVYAESDARLNFRKDVVEFLLLLSTEDPTFVAAIDRMLKYLWRGSSQSEEMGQDVAYLLGRVAGAQPIKDEMLRDPGVMLKFWPIVGDQLRDEVANPKPYVPQDGVPEPTTTPEERLATWQRLAEPMDAWWPEVPAWREEVKETFARWERQDPAFVALWTETREWSLADFRRIFDELGAEFDVWFFESEVEDEGRRIVQDLLAKGIAEVSDGLPVVKIDEKLGLAEPTYRTLPILRSDGSTLYATKDLALTKRKFDEYGVDRAIWVVDVRQSLYFQQVFKTLELYGFEQAAQAHHLGYEMVRLPEGVISSRKGNVPVYDDIRDAVVARAQEIVEEKNAGLAPAAKAEVAWQVAIGSLKYAMLARDNNKVVTFDLDEALSFDGHAAPYIQYAHARACRILEHAGLEAEGLAAAAGGLDFGGELAAEELGLLQAVSALPEAVQQAAAEYRPLVIANYVFDLARRFNDFYHACPVLPSAEPTRTARLALTAATAQALRNGLGLLGIAAPAAM